MSIKFNFNSNSEGDITYGRNVVVSIISLAAQEINGVAGLQGRGVRTEINGNVINVDVYINVYYGISCKEVAYRVQENIKNNVETMTDYKVDVINVNILGVSFQKTESRGSL